MSPDDPDRPFDQPWQAQLFAMKEALQSAGHFDSTDWTERLAARIANAQTEADETDYWRCWALALEDLLIRTGLAGTGDVARLARSWQAAALATPHGEPITLEGPDATCAAASESSTEVGITSRLETRSGP